MNPAIRPFHRTLALIAAAMAGTAWSLTALAAPPDEPAGGTPASCAGIGISGHATDGPAAVAAEVAAIPQPRGQFIGPFAKHHLETHEACEDVFGE